MSKNTQSQLETGQPKKKKKNKKKGSSELYSFIQVFLPIYGSKFKIPIAVEIWQLFQHLNK